MTTAARLDWKPASPHLSPRKGNLMSDATFYERIRSAADVLVDVIARNMDHSHLAWTPAELRAVASVWEDEDAVAAVRAAEVASFAADLRALWNSSPTPANTTFFNHVAEKLYEAGWRREHENS